MTEFDPNPRDGAVDDVRQHWRDETDTFGRVYDSILGIPDPTPYTEIAEIADCAPNTAKKHLERLTEMGLVRADRDSRPARFQRHDGYFEWQEVSRLAEALTVEQIIDRVQRLEARRAEFEARFDTTDPASVSVFDQDDHDAIHERMDAVSEWQSIDRDIRRYELARRLAQHDGHLLPA